MKTVLIKCGGSVIDELSPSFFTSLKELEKEGYHLLFVHGGGPDINALLELYQVPREFENGLRKTTAETMEIVEMVLAGKTNRTLAAKLTSHGFNAFGVNGSDGGFLQANIIDQEKLGFVGDIIKVKTDVISMLLNGRYTPVITPIATTASGVKLNINADFAAAAIANNLQVDHCIFVTDVQGIIINGELVPQLSKQEIESYIHTGLITGGMIPKVRSAVDVIEKGLQSVRIVSGKEVFFSQSKWVGTEIIAKEGILR
ncbi:acetylglutamate kinase [Cytobacillus praedii]|uniref:Acetylglutamate kinase n=1 Tax=Cytobacillus praedii TaxID=1742358 RepID=A0A4R1B1T9_9BACI|nr:acetylglutamate kinase [Cytobacillus praedii]TCJ04438.1 acetylglutamate kinase [Cytobacillus praedii]